MTYKAYSDLDVWKQNRNLANYIYSVSKQFPKEEMYGLTNQMRRCAISIASNIAEGCGRQHTKDSLQFYYISRGSIYELETQFYIAFDQEYINQTELEEGLEKITSCKKLLNGFINYFHTLN